MPPSTHLSTVLTPFQSLFSAPTWRKVQRLLIGTLLARGRRTITAALRHTGQGDTPAFSLYHHVLNRARWSALKGSRRLLALLVQTFGAARSSLTFVIDETLERRWGPRLKKRGHYRDSLASSRKRTVTSSGLRWVVLALVITPPWNRRCWALPILSVPAARTRGQRAPGAEAQDDCPMGTPADTGGKALAAARRHHRAWRSSLQCRGTRTCLSALLGAPDCAPAP